MESQEMPIGMIIIVIAILIVTIVSMWKLFQKAGREGWEAIIPIYNSYVMTQLVNKPGYWVILMLIPYVGMIWSIWVLNLFVKGFGKDSGYTVGILFLPFIFLPMLAFGDAKWQGTPEIDQTDVLDSDMV